MIISEKQIMKLLMVAEYYAQLAYELNDGQPTELGAAARKLVTEIYLQQSSELKVIE